VSTPEHTGTVIAVDGPSGSGKSSAARGVARALGFAYLDTGAMYRATTWWMITHDVDLADPAAIAARAGEPGLEIGTDPGAPTVAVDGTDVSRPIRSREVTNSVSAVSSVPEIRAWLIARQREIAGAACDRGAGIVVEGRDIGTVVAPDAPVKVYLTASAEARARRRTGDRNAERVSVDANEAEMARRDRLDAAQSAKAADAVLIDSTDMGLDDVIDEVLHLVKERVPA
jgi:cytidylate kinase